MSGKIPIYQQYSHLYAYDIQTKSHLLKSGALYKKRVAVYPNRFIESASMFPQPIPEPPKLNINHVEQKKTMTQIGQSNPPPAPTDEQLKEQQKQKENEEIRNNIQKIIREELKNNPEQYKNKTAEDMSNMFRNTLIEKLSGITPKVKEDKVTKKPMFTLKSTDTDSYLKKWKFNINKQDDEYGDEDNENEEYAEYDMFEE
jgi:hypothetical protein